MKLGTRMLLRRITKHVKDQNWFAVGIDFVIVVIGVFIGIQVANWNASRTDRAMEAAFLERMAVDVDSARAQLAGFLIAREERLQSIAKVENMYLGDGGGVPLSELECTQLAGSYMITHPPVAVPSITEAFAGGRIELLTEPDLIQALIVVPPLSDNPKLIDTLERTGISFVCVSPKLNGYTGPSVRMDDRSAARDITQYLLELGHTRVGHIKGPPDHRSSELRYAGFNEAFAAAGMTVDRDLVVSGDFTYVSGMRSATMLINRERPPTAIFATNDDMASGAIAAAHQAGLRVPEDLSVVGFDDTANASAMWPALTTVRQPIREMASSAIKLLADSVAHNRARLPLETPKLTLDYELMIRDSAAPPKQSD